MADVMFDAAKVARLRVAYLRARKAEQKCFTFDGQEYLTDYAKYLLEYLIHKFGDVG